jgi:hypothetical protein
MNNPDYQELDQRTKDNNYLVPVGDGKFLKIPKSREWGVVFGVLFERMLEFARTGEIGAFKGFGSTLATNIAPTNPIENNILSPIVFNIPTNKDFAGRPIVPGNLQGLSPKYQYDDRTSELAKALGQAFNMSPKQIDYLIRSYSGVIGQLGIPLLGGSSSTNPLAASFIADKAYSNKATNEFYDNKEKYTVKYNDMNFKGEFDPKIKAIKTYYDRAATQITNVNKTRKDMDSKGESQEKVREYRELMNSIAKQANDFERAISKGENVFVVIYGLDRNAHVDKANEILLQAEKPGDYIKVLPTYFEDKDKNKINLTPAQYKEFQQIFRDKLNERIKGDGSYPNKVTLKGRVNQAYEYAEKQMKKKLGIK